MPDTRPELASPEVPTSLLQLANITLNSGRSSFFKLECDALTDEDWNAAAGMLARIVPPFSRVSGVPRGGVPLARALDRYAHPLASGLLIVDDVWTTGGSMERFRQAEQPWEVSGITGAVLFARGPVADWVTPLFTLHEGLWHA